MADEIMKDCRRVDRLLLWGRSKLVGVILYCSLYGEVSDIDVLIKAEQQFFNKLGRKNL
jgi:hypothetical protein